VQPAIEDFFESKLHPPPVRSALVPRRALVDRLAAADDVPIASVVAPAGYGKSTLLAEWARRDPTRVAWLSIDRHDNDVSVLLPYAAAALDRIAPVDPELLKPPTRRSVTAGAARLANAMGGMTQPVVLVLDHVELLDDRECLDTIGELALHLTGGSRLALASRGEPPVPMPRLRAGGDVVEIGVEDLAMTFEEARELLEGAGVEIDSDEVEKLLERTEGWPVGLYLAALALKAGGSHENAGIAFSGDDKLIADYLRSEVLSRLSTPEVEFLTRTAVLERMSAGLCDAVLDTSGSHAMLDALARSNLLLVSLDRRGDWYRYHHLFRDLLRVELEQREPALIPTLNLRAARWCEEHRLPDLAMEHAYAAGDRDLVNRLVLTDGPMIYAVGKSASLSRWLRWLADPDGLAHYPAAAVLGAMLFSSRGFAAEADHWADAAELRDTTSSAEDRIRAAPDRVLPDGSTLESWWAVLRILRAADGLEAVRRDIDIALNGLSRNSGYRGPAIAFRGLCDLFESKEDSADQNFALSVDMSRQSGRMPAVVAALSERGLMACRKNEWAVAADFTRQTLEAIDTWRLEDYAEAALAYALAAQVALHDGDEELGRRHLTNGARIRPNLTHSRPITSVQTLLELGRAYAMVHDTAGAREVLRQASEILRRTPHLGNLPAQVEQLGASLETMRSGTVGASSLTAAELRLVPYLPTHLTFPQIAERLYVSRNTVKSQAISVYQKLGVSSRSEAVEHLEKLGLLDI
jgi:LuxR family maltose regulon positive regulatory protein